MYSSIQLKKEISTFPDVIVQVEFEEETVNFVIDIFSVSECNVTGQGLIFVLAWKIISFD